MTALTKTTDRRKLLTSGLAAGLLAVSGLAITARPQVGGRLRAALPGGAQALSWDARKGFGLFMAAAGQGAVFDTLTEVAADGSLRGELATAWHASRDARTWVFDLRPGVAFHDGTPFDSASVVESLRLHMAAGSGGAGWHLVSNLDTIKAQTPLQVQVTLHSGNADFPYLLSDRHLIVYPAGKVAQAMAQGIGTGLYRVAKFEPGQRFVGWRVANHYKDGTAGWVDQIEFLAVEDSAQRVALLRAGRVDTAAQIDPADAAALSDSAGLRVSSIPGNQHLALDASALPAPAQKALKLAIDRDQVLRDGLLGYGHVGHDSPFGPFNQYYDPTPIGHADPDQAQHLLKAADVHGLGLTIAPLGPMPAALGLSLWPSLLASGFGQHPGPRVQAQLWSGRVTEDWMLAANPNLGGNSDEIDRLRAQARAEFDPLRRAELYHALQVGLRAQSPVVIPVFANFLQAMSRRVADPGNQGNLWPMDNARFAERWWLS